MLDTANHVAPAVKVTRETLESVLTTLPFIARQALKLASRIEYGSLTLRLPDGRGFVFEGAQKGPDAEMIIHDYAFAKRMMTGGDIGVAESFLRGEWEAKDLTVFLQLFAANHHLISMMLEGRAIIRYWQLFRHWLNRNTKSGSKRNIHAHYDLGNAFYTQWLDPTMTYSSALFETPEKDLQSGQTAKYAALARETKIGSNDSVLEIGCGWGGFAEFAAKEIGCRVTGLTISQEQFDYAKKRIFNAGLNEKVEIKLQDYRDERGLYDRIASIEMFEAVGEQFWPVYFNTLSERLKAGGKAGLQVITIQDRFFQTYRREMDFIRRYIFPGGMLPSPGIMKQLGERVGMMIQHERIFGVDYADTLAQWRDRFRAAWPDLMPLGFDERFRRMWEYYLAYCEAGFRTGNIDVRQIIYSK
ncbi:MAG: class I SAM-dependent methyltransferase [Alphaproteobacteria bacterium]|nr:class I SAM-dependent methyltransferase [Alphaproteobacteria bacterium]